MASPIPPVMETNLSNLPDGNSTLHAYNACLDLQQKVTTADDLMHVRILGYLILHAPSEIARAEVVKSIHSCSQDEKKLLILGECFRLWYITPFKQFKGGTPAASDHPSRPSYDRLKEDLKAPIQEEPKDHRQAKAQALIRDGYKCVATGMYDKSIKGSDIMMVPQDADFVNTECAHILPESIYFNISKPGDKKEYTALVLAVLQCFGYDTNKVNGTKVHSLYNVMTMERNAHDLFDRLEMWFESTGVENHYRVQTIDKLSIISPEAMFTSSDPANLSLPSGQLLALHAACAKVAHLSGAREYIDKLDCDADDLDVLALDGSSQDVLSHVLGMLTPPVDTVV